MADLALPVYYRRHHPESISPIYHLVLPLLGAGAIGFPLYELVKPGQPAPFNHYPLIALEVLVAALIYGAVVFHATAPSASASARSWPTPNSSATSANR